MWHAVQYFRKKELLLGASSLGVLCKSILWKVYKFNGAVDEMSVNQNTCIYLLVSMYACMYMSVYVCLLLLKVCY